MSLGETPDAVLLDVEEALEAIAEVTGKSMREDITADIFSRFCVGK
jgi:tRNA modification GTPase